MPSVSVLIDLKQNQLAVTDNGVRFEEQQYTKFLAPNFLFKSGNTRGHKGVGSTYLAYGFNYMKIIEAWGTGLRRIRNSCKEYELPEPVIEESGDGFRVIFYRKAVNVDQNIGSSIENRLIELLIQYPAITQQEAVFAGGLLC